jgi:hypothetical protein
VTPREVEQALALAEHHARLGAENIARQRAIIRELDSDGRIAASSASGVNGLRTLPTSANSGGYARFSP